MRRRREDTGRAGGAADAGNALALEGVDRRTAAAQTCGMDRQTLRDWVHRYNAEGLAGLSNRRGAPRSRRLDAGQLGELVCWLEAGPDPAVDGVVRWRRQDLQRPDHRTVSGWSCTSGRSASIWRRSATGGSRCARAIRRTDPEAQEAFKKTSPTR